MATKYDEYAGLNLNEIGREGFSNRLAPGQYVAWGTQLGMPDRTAPSSITTNMPQIANSARGIGIETMPTTSQLQQQYRGIDRSQLGPINIPNIPRPSDNMMVNPAGRPMSDVEAMVRGQALRGEGMSVAQRGMMRGQIAGEAGTVGAAARAKQEADELKAQQEFEIKKRQATYTGEAADTRLKLVQQKAAMDTLKQQEAYAQKLGLLDKAEGYKNERMKLQSQIKIDEAKEILGVKFGQDVQATKTAFENSITKMKAAGEIKSKQEEINAREGIRKSLATELVGQYNTLTEALAQVDAILPSLPDAPASTPAATPPAATAAPAPASGDMNGDGKIDDKDFQIAQGRISAIQSVILGGVRISGGKPTSVPLSREDIDMLKKQLSDLKAIKPIKL